MTCLCSIYLDVRTLEGKIQNECGDLSKAVKGWNCSCEARETCWDRQGSGEQH